MPDLPLLQLLAAPLLKLPPLQQELPQLQLVILDYLLLATLEPDFPRLLGALQRPGTCPLLLPEEPRQVVVLEMALP
jgi:hypothetical protein